METTYTIGEAAKIIGVEGKNSSTVRLWTEIFADCLSPSTRPEKGQLRLYTQSDLKVLLKVRDLRQQHLPYELIRQRLTAGEVAIEDGPEEKVVHVRQPETRPVRVLSVDELREALAPVFEAAEALNHLSKEADQSGFGLQMEVSRVAAAVEALSEKLTMMQTELLALRADWMVAESSRQRSESGRTREGIGLSQPASPPANTGSRSVVPATPIVGPEDKSPRPETPREVVPAARPVDPSVVPSLSSALNEYGLRPLPARLAGQALGAMNLCQRCGSTTRPLGVTPTQRVMFSCIACGEVAILPLDRLDKATGTTPSFWSRLWSFFRRLFS